MRKILYLYGILFILFAIAFIQISSAENTTDTSYERTVSLAPSITETIYAINGQDKLIGVTIFCNYPEGAKSKTKIGGYTTPSIETIVFLDPDLVFAHDLTDPDDIVLLRNANITVVVINTSATIDGIYYKIRTIAKYLGKAHDGENLITSMEERIEKIKKIKSELIFSSPTVAQIAWTDPLWVTGRETFIQSIIETAGGTNVYSDVYRWQPVSAETLITRDPDIIIAPVGNSHDVYNDIFFSYKFKNLKAVKNNDVYKIAEDIIARDSPRITDALESVMGMFISHQYNHIPKYCLNNNDCTSGNCDFSIHICFKLNSESCVFDKECISSYCENGICKEKFSEKISNDTPGNSGVGGNYGRGGTSLVKYVYIDGENKPVNMEKMSFPPEIFNFSEIFGLKQTINLGGNFKDAEITINVKNKTRKFKLDENGATTLTIPDYGSAEITISKSDFKNWTKTINVYVGTLNITKISGEKYGDEFKFKVTTKDGSLVKDAKVEVYGKTLMTDANGIVKTTIKTMQAGLESSTSMENYKGSSISFDVQAIGKLNIEVPEKVKQGETITITVTNENKNPVLNAKVTINGIGHTTDADGKIEYNVTTISLTLKTEKEGYISSEVISVAVKKDAVFENEMYNETHNETKKNTSAYDNLLSPLNLTVISVILIIALIIFLKWGKK